MTIKTSYWRTVHERCWALAKKAVGLESRDRMITVVIVQLLIGFGIFVVLHGTEAWVRLISAAAPFLLIPIWYLIKLPAVPPFLAQEALEIYAASQAAIEAEKDALKLELTALRKQLSAREGREEAAKVLASLLRQGDQMCIRKIKSDAEYTDFLSELKTYVESIPAKLSGLISNAELVVLCSRPPTDVIGRGDGFNERHRANLYLLETLSRRLGALIERYAT